MIKKRRNLLIALLLLIFVCVLLLSIVFLVAGKKPAALFISDSSYRSRVALDKETIGTARDAGFRFLSIELDDATVIGDSNQLIEQVQSLIDEHRAELVIFSPVVSSLLTLARPEIQQLQGAKYSPLLVAMGQASFGTALYDVVLASQPEAGWAEAAAYLMVHNGATALLYQEDEASALAVDAFKQVYTDPDLVIEKQPEDGSRRHAESVLETLWEDSVAFIASPYLRSMQYFVQDSRFLWVVDDRFAPLLPERRIVGVVGDNLAASFAPLFEMARQNKAKRGLEILLPLEREFRLVNPIQ